MTPSLILRDESIRQRAIERIRMLRLDVPDPWAVYITPHKRIRSKEQNDKMWAMLTDISRQKQWPVNGVMSWMEPRDWKILFAAALKQENRMALGLNGGLVVLGGSTSSLPPSDMSDLIELIYAWGVEKGVRWSAE